MDIGELTLEEKASLCIGSDFWHTAPVDRLGLRRVCVSDGPHGLRRQPDDGEHIGIGGSLPATCFPTAAALGSSWDPQLAEQVGAAIGAEALAQDVAVVLGPGINIKRSPLCGRNFEYFAEDPVHAGRLGAALVRGIQSQGVGTSLKHFAANNQETGRVLISADVDERTLREIYLAGFEHIVRETQPWTVMCSYNRINGLHASQSRWLLTDVLRDEWGFEGLVVSDWGAVHDRVAALRAGLDLEMPPYLGVSDRAVVDAVRAGELDESVLDAAVARVVALVERSAPPTDGFDAGAHHALARSVAADCGVLLKNEGSVLPLQLTAGQTVAVIGEFARTPRFQGAGSSQVAPTRVDTALDELRAGVPAGVQVEFAAGFTLEEGSDAGLADEACALAARADVVIAFLGLPASAESEGYDRTHIDLPADQLALLARLARANPAVVVVLANGSAVRVSTWEADVAAVLEMWLTGQAAGGACADLLLGVANPSGRLAETIPVRLEDCPSFLNFPGEAGHVRYGEGVFVGYRGYDASAVQVSHPFGHGLSYTTFTYADLSADVTGSGDGVRVDVTCTVTNTGERAGKEVVQLYVGDPVASVARPPRELKAFDKVTLEPGASTEVRFSLAARDLSFWSTLRHNWVVEAGRFDIAVGASSRDIRLNTSIEVDAPPAGLPLTAMSSLEDWWADPTGRELLVDAVSADSALRTDPHFAMMMGSFPISSLPVFGTGLSAADIDDIVRARAARPA